MNYNCVREYSQLELSQRVYWVPITRELYVHNGWILTSYPGYYNLRVHTWRSIIIIRHCPNSYGKWPAIKEGRHKCNNKLQHQSLRSVRSSPVTSSLPHNIPVKSQTNLTRWFEVVAHGHRKLEHNAKDNSNKDRDNHNEKSRPTT
jgi:hypothetical protein